MIEEPIDETYFNWLYHKVASVEIRTPSLDYFTLIRDLHSTEFIWLISGDDNRAEDGIDIRKEFLIASFLPKNTSWSHIACSVLEMLIGLSRRAEHVSDFSSREWFWIFLENLGLSDLNDTKSNITDEVNQVLDIFIWRTYDYNGHGGLFPLNNPSKDQRKVELWYQFSEYISEIECQ